MPIGDLSERASDASFWRGLLSHTDLADHLPPSWQFPDTALQAGYFLSGPGEAAAEWLILGALDAAGRPEALALYRPSAWDSDFFGRACGFLDWLWCRREEDYPRFCRELCQALAERGQEFLAAKLPVSAWARAQALEAAGARLVDSELILGHQACATPAPTTSGPWTIRPAEARDAAALEGMDIDFSHGRFFNDSRIDPDLARELWRRALVNSLHGLAEWVLLAEAESRPAGVVTIQKASSPPGAVAAANLFIVGAEPRWQGTGLMPDLMAQAVGVAGECCSPVMVEVSAANRRALNFYLKTGFRTVLGGRTVLHLWLDRDQGK